MDVTAIASLLMALAVLLAGGVVKGVVGIALPLVTVPVLALVYPVPLAVSTMAVPIIASNILQMGQGVGWRGAVARFWPVMLGVVAGVLAGAQMLVALDEARLSVTLGAILVLFVALHFAPFDIAVPPRRERPIGLAVGGVAGLLGGLSSFYGPLLVMFLMTLRLAKDVFIPSIATLYLTGALSLYGSLAAYRILGWREALISAAALVPVYAGMRLGRHLRDRLDERVFLRALHITLALIGITLVLRGVM